jgi:hypothetical protein
MDLLKNTLAANATFSTASGILLSIFPEKFAELFEVNNALIFRIIGVVLLFFAGFVFSQVKKYDVKLVKFIISQDALWVVGSLLLVLLQPFGISQTGNNMIAGVAVIIFLFAVGQIQGLKQSKN